MVFCQVQLKHAFEVIEFLIDIFDSIFKFRKYLF